MPPPAKITILGAGISGLVLARALQARHLPFTLYEKIPQSAALKRNNYSITLHPKSYRPLLKILNISEETFRRKTAVGDIGGGALRVNRREFENLLREGMEVNWGEEVKFVIGKGAVEFSSGKKEIADVVVGADGVHSAIRKAVMPQAELEVLPFVVFNGKRKMARDEFERDLIEEEKGKLFFARSMSPCLFRVSIDSRTETEVAVSWTYSRPAHRDRGDVLWRPNRAKEEAGQIPEELFVEIRGSWSSLEEPLDEVFDVKVMRNDRILHWLMRKLQIDQTLLEQQAREKNVLLIGEAAHAEPILGGNGANEAIEDAIELAEFLAREDGGELEKFYALRKEEWDVGIEKSDMRIMSEMHGLPRPHLW